jgi:predicted outer membrane protein
MPLSRNVRIFAAGVLQEESQRDYEWDEVRTERDKDLANTDWRAVKDRTMSQAWKDYRQALRDLPQNFETANDAVDNWPEAPE